MTQASTMITEARAFAGQTQSAASNAINAALSAASAVRFGWVQPGELTKLDKPDFGIDIAAPSLPPVPFNLPASVGAAPTFQDVDRVDASEGLPVVFAKEAPTIDAPNAPSQLQEFNEVMDTLDLNIDLGQAPSPMFGVAPTMGAYSTPEKPNATIAAFSGSVPELSMAAPGDLGAQMQGWYHEAAPEFISMVNGYVDAELVKLNPQFHTQMDKIETQLSKYLAGGTGLKASVEDAIYSRARSKNDAEARRVRDQSLADAAARGFTMPAGALLSATQQARQAGADSNAKAAAEIVVMQAEMEQKNLQFAVSTSTGLRTAMVNASLSYMQGLGTLNGQALEYSKSILTAVVQTFDIVVKAYSAQVERLRAEVMAYDAYLKGVNANVERYRAEIAGEQAKAQVDLAKVQAYTAIINVEQTKIAAYKAYVDAQIGAAQLQKLKVEVFQAKVQAYGAEVSAKNAEWQGYSAQWSGELSKLAGYKAEVDAYGSKVHAYSAGIAGKSAAAQAQAMTNESRAKQYAAQLSGYSSAVDAAGKVASTTLENNRQEIVAFQAEAAAKTARLNSQIEYYKGVSMIDIEKMKLDVNTLLASSEHSFKQMGLVAQLHTANAQIQAGYSGAALSGMNTLASESFTQ